ncbi:hypothetical protein ACE1CD_31995 [Aerosakkonema sp. BLCC-F183]
MMQVILLKASAGERAGESGCETQRARATVANPSDIFVNIQYTTKE